jgi:hypothetical protein
VDNFLNLVKTLSVADALKKAEVTPSELAHILKLFIEQRKLKLEDN